MSEHQGDGGFAMDSRHRSSRSQSFQLGQPGHDLPVVRHHPPLPIAKKLGFQGEQIILDIQQMAGAEAIDEELAVKMVVLVLKRPGEQSIDLVLLFLSGKVIGYGDDAFGASNGSVDFGKAEATFLGFDVAALLEDRGVDEDMLLILGSRVAGGVENKNAVRQIHLVGRKPDALMMVISSTFRRWLCATRHRRV